MKYLLNMHQILENHRVNPGIQAALMKGLREALHMLPKPAETWSRDIEEAYDEQSIIGWTRFIYGHVSTKWRNLQEQWEKELPTLPQPRKPEQWVVRTIAESWAFVLATWHARNDDKHGKDAAKEERERQALEAQVEDAYERRGVLPLQAQDFFSCPIEEKMNERPSELKEWLRAVRRLIRNAEARQASEEADKERQAEAGKALGMRAISTYFTAKRKEGV
jgi:hypothetical protein